MVILYIKLILVNNYEISQWEIYFLELWTNHRLLPSINAKKIFKLLDIKEYDLFIEYFSPFSIFIFNKYIEYEVTISIFLEFICVFVFICTERQIQSIYLLYI